MACAGAYRYRFDDMTEETPLKQETPRERLFRLHEEMCKEARALMRKKNNDYSTEGDPFRNFRMFGGLGFLVRMSDKLSRLRTYVERGDFDVKDESARDTLIDLVNYCVLLQAYWDEGNR